MKQPYNHEKDTLKDKRKTQKLARFLRNSVRNGIKADISRSLNKIPKRMTTVYELDQIRKLNREKARFNHSVPCANENGDNNAQNDAAYNGPANHPIFSI